MPAALQAYAGLVASLLAATATARVTDRLANQLRAALECRSLIEQAVEILVHREDLQLPAAFGWLATSARSSGRTLVQMAGGVVGGAPLPSDGLAWAKAERRDDAVSRRSPRRPQPLGAASLVLATAWYRRPRYSESPAFRSRASASRSRWSAR